MSVSDTVVSAHLSPKCFARMAQLVRSELGIKMPESKVSMIESRLLRRIRELGLQSMEEYTEYLFSPENGRQEQVHFIDRITTNKTDFFREPQHFNFLTHTALPGLCRTHGAGQGRRVAVWSAGCSSGEEAYTLAMVLSEFAATRGDIDFQILATDISTRVLAKAREGIYDEATIGPVPPALRKKYLLQSRDPQVRLVRVTPDLRRRVSFHRLNFMDQSYGVYGVFDFIFFRNVMIYFDRSTQEAVVNRLCRNLDSGGYLFVSHSESLCGLNVPVVPVGPAVFRKPG
jgi:chemotaxis protein methyltransferase CheR